jgi:hypothetical protein
MSQPDFEANIQHFEIRRDDNLWAKRGASIAKLADLMHECARPPNFSNLKTLILCFEVDICKNQVPSPFETMSIHTALATASSLKCLEIALSSVTCNASDHACQNRRPWPRLHGNFGKIVPLIPFHQLEYVKLEEFDFTDDEICSWLFMQPALTHLSLIRPHLEGKWTDVVRKWSENPSFNLQALTLSSPWDHEILENEGYEEQMGPSLFVPNGKIPSRIPDEDLLTFVNGGGENPFESRRWTYVDKFVAERREIIEDHMSDFSDMSEVQDPEEWSEELKWAHGWPLGPEESWDPAECDRNYYFDEEEDNDDDDEEENSDIEMQDVV